MKKTRGKKKVSNSHKVEKKKSFHLQDHFLLYVIIAILLICGIFLFISNSLTGNFAVDVTGNEVTEASGGVAGKSIPEINFLKEPLPNWGASIINFFNVGVPDSLGKGIEKNWQSFIITILVFVIILSGMYGILSLTSIFDEDWIIWVMSIGLAIIAALTGLIRGITIFLIQFAAGFGALGIILEILISIGIFIGLSLGSAKVAMFAAKRQAGKYLAKATRGIGQIRAGVKTAKALGEEAAEGE